MKILLLEDSILDYKRINKVLTQSDFEVVHAVNSSQVFELLNEGEKPDLFIMDIELEKEEIENDKMDGLEVAKKARKMHAAPIVVLTNH